MIDFRYHLVSIVAIFLALAVGILLGATLLQDPAVNTAQELTAQLTKTKAELRGQLDTLQGREAGTDTFIAAKTPDLVAAQLAGQRVLLVETPGSSATVREATQQVLLQAGAEISGSVTLTEKFADPKGTGVLDGLVNQLKPANMVFPATATPWDRAAALLGAALLTTDPAQAGTPDTATNSVLGAFEEGGLISIDGDPAKRATLAVMFAPERPYEGEDADVQAAALASVAGGLDAASTGAVLAGTVPTTATPGDAIAAVRDDSDIAKGVSTVDTADMPVGRVVVVYSLREQMAGHAGQYGVGTGASGPMPTVTATPSPTTESGS